VLALGVEAGAERQRAGAALRELAWPFAAGFATEQAAQVLELIEGSLHDSARSLPVPSSWLVGADGRLLALYLGRVDPEQVVRDLGLADLSDAERRDAAVPFPGRWIAAPPAPVDDLVASRLASHGLDRAAAEYGLPQVETRELTTATFELGLAQARQRQGRLDEAIGHYRKALTVDPALFEAARGLALALHSKGDYTAARAAYGRALTLEPADATTRCNLGLVLLALGEVEGARRELEALRSLSSDLATTLAERIRMVEGGR
jgi:tetratricopeptide (TPR) repeat protein